MFKQIGKIFFKYDLENPLIKPIIIDLAKYNKNTNNKYNTQKTKETNNNKKTKHNKDMKK
jgi:hypothetical protein